MSGTSLDGIDVALLEVEEGLLVPSPRTQEFPSVRWELSAYRSYPFTPSQRETIQEAMVAGTARDLGMLHAHLGEMFAEAVLDLLEAEGVPTESVSAVGSHGQTLWHEPPKEGKRGSSFQLGCPATLAERTGIGVVSDFRSRDLAAGGHGAPLVPWADRVFFSSPKSARAIQNLGGIGNVTWLPPEGDERALLAFDTGPGVVLMNLAAEVASGGALSHDRDGKLASEGYVSSTLLERLLSHPFFQQPPPRSTGREVFGLQMVRMAIEEVERESGKGLVPGLAQRGWTDLLATLTAFTARTVGDAYRRWVIPLGVDEVFLAGGGGRNPALVRAIQNELDPLPVRPWEELGMNPDAREAAAFALMAWAHLRRIPANVPQATGSEGTRVLGSWTPGKGREMDA